MLTPIFPVRIVHISGLEWHRYMCGEFTHESRAGWIRKTKKSSVFNTY